MLIVGVEAESGPGFGCDCDFVDFDFDFEFDFGFGSGSGFESGSGSGFGSGFGFGCDLGCVSIAVHEHRLKQPEWVQRSTSSVEVAHAHSRQTRYGCGHFWQYVGSEAVAEHQHDFAACVVAMVRHLRAR